MIFISVILLIITTYPIYTQKQKPTVTLSQKTQKNPSPSLTKDSISKISNQSPSHNYPKATQQNINKEDKLLKVDSATKIESKYQLPIKNEPRQIHKQTYNKANPADPRSRAAD